MGSNESTNQCCAGVPASIKKTYSKHLFTAAAHLIKGTINTNICYYQDNVFFFFLMKGLATLPAHYQIACIHLQRVWQLNWPACILTGLSPTERPLLCFSFHNVPNVQTAEQLKSYIKQAQKKIVLSELQQLFSTVPSRLLKGDANQRETCRCIYICL